MPDCAQQLFAISDRLEDYYRDMQDMEFTIQDGKLWMLQTRNGKRTGAAMVKIAMDLLRDGKIDEKTALLRMEPQKLDELLHPVFDKSASNAPKWLPRVFPHLPALLPAKSYSLPKTLKNGPIRNAKWFSYVSKPHPKTSAVWLWLKVSSPCVAV